MSDVCPSDVCPSECMKCKATARNDNDIIDHGDSVMLCENCSIDTLGRPKCRNDDGGWCDWCTAYWDDDSKMDTIRLRYDSYVDVKVPKIAARKMILESEANCDRDNNTGDRYGDLYYTDVDGNEHKFTGEENDFVGKFAQEVLRAGDCLLGEY